MKNKKDKKSLIVLLPVVVFVLTFILVKVISSSFALNPDTAVDVGIPSGTVYQMVRKNIYSWHLITHNFNSFSSTNASGTKLIQTTSAISGSKRQAVVYCATEGKTLSSSSKRTRYPLNSSQVSKLSAGKKTKLTRVMPYMYPYINLGLNADENTENLKSILKYGITTNSGRVSALSTYDTYKFNNLTAQEAITAVQAAIWNIEKGYSYAYYAYRGTISSFSEFNECSEYKTNKVITSEEQGWYNASGCSSSGNFYKFVFKHSKDSNTANRINALIKWYLDLSTTEITTEEKTFNLSNSNFDTTNRVLTTTFDTNLSNYTVTFKDDANQTLTATKNGNEYTVSNIGDSVKSVSWSVTATGDSKNVYYYKASSGQDFIGLEHGKYTNNGTIAVEHVKKGNLIIYKREATADGITVITQATNDFDNSNCNGTCLSNAKFELYYGDENNKQLYREIELDYSNGDTYTFNNLPAGTYYLKETQPAYGYDLYPSGTTITYDSTTGTTTNDGFIRIDITDNTTIGVIVNNVQMRICFRKLDASSGNRILNNATYQIEDIDGFVINQFLTHEQEGDYCLTGELQTGSYFLQEIKAPDGYSLDATKYHFTIGRGDNDISSLEDMQLHIDYENISANQNSVIILTDRKEVEISKSDATTGACVSGAELVIRDSNNNEIDRWISTCGGTGTSNVDEEELDVTSCTTGCTVDISSGEYICPDTSADEGAYICTETDVETSKDSHKVALNPGTYTLTEYMTEELQRQGYSTSESITFTVDENGSVKEKIDMKDAPINVCLYKVGKGSKTPIKGAKFNIYKEDGSLYDSFTTTTTENCLTRVPFGTYTIKEIEAPSGYKALNDEIKIEVKNTKDKQYFYVENEVVAPKTLMDSTKILVIISLIFMVFGIGMVGYYGIKKKN